MTSATLPTLDLSRLQQGEEEAAAFRRDLREATHDYGFFYLTGHGIPQELFDGMIGTARRFFDLPEVDKLEIENVKSRHFRGYTRVGGERTQGKVDWREQIDIGPERAAVEKREGVAPYWTLEGPNMWPSALPELRDVVSEWEANMNKVAITLMRAWAESLGADPDTFDAAFAHDPSTLIKIVRYPGKEDPTPQQGVGAHKDFGVLTLLYVEEGKAGLQVEKDGEWIDAPPIPYTFVVNIGELLEVATGGYLRATIHRVISPKAGEDRISIPYFYAPALDATIPTIPLPPELAARAKGVTPDAHGEPLYATYGENALKSRLRAHPDVAAIHHPELVKVPVPAA
ncbi:isopenicillin N synthase family oxygenase [Salinibacterium sp. dk2585]|uniref:isopenicillin N synthase family dioxygenase n=1 Tax=unclassified Salinibacterium TaxID=2632331 RepID=UPI0011C2501A|nr:MULTISPECIES: 2-oxoglutarate and iron-dependent oxygenase domain-containing protein [unclassified Salinibacterium]QEE62423.1 isopenicillin N synthase family oxygenase [Salinibacterium sp. dk2585]TXK52694.1 isopenicillin N synthase family oxygenase [Salinibacterium sp. dk5596]